MESTRARPLRFPRWEFLLLFSGAWLAAEAAAVGAWWTDVPKLETWRAHASDPAIVKRAIFSTKGKVRWLPTRLESPSCGGLERAWAWVTHRLSPGERLEVAAGKALGAELAKGLGPCYSAVQLNIEPMPAPPDWLIPFLKAVKDRLPSGVSLRLAAPPVTMVPLSGPSWRPDAAADVLRAADGLDLMLYDTGARDADSYARVLGEAGSFARHASRSEGKYRLLLGLPSYPDRTRLHDRGTENLEAAWKALPRLPAIAREGWCTADVAVYAGWTATAADLETLKRIGEWRKHGCVEQAIEKRPG